VLNKGNLFLPVEIEIFYKNGSSKQLSFEMDIWKSNVSSFKIPVTRINEVAKITLGNAFILDVDSSNNTIKFD